MAGTVPGRVPEVPADAPLGLSWPDERVFEALVGGRSAPMACPREGCPGLGRSVPHRRLGSGADRAVP
jgi:hypothetical protein